MKELNNVERELKQIGVEIIGLITDNEPKMVKVRGDFEEQHRLMEKHIACPGDPPHALQLVIGDVLTHKLWENICNQSNILQKGFKNTRCKQFLKVNSLMIRIL